MEKHMRKFVFATVLTIISTDAMASQDAAEIYGHAAANKRLRAAPAFSRSNIVTVPPKQKGPLETLFSFLFRDDNEDDEVIYSSDSDDESREEEQENINRSTPSNLPPMNIFAWPALEPSDDVILLPATQDVKPAESKAIYRFNGVAEISLEELRDPAARFKDIPYHMALQKIATQEDCHIALEYLGKRVGIASLRAFASTGLNPIVLPGFIQYIKKNPSSFKGVSRLLWSGHELDVAQINDLLSFLTQEGRDQAVLDLTPGSNCDPITLVGIAMRYTLRHPDLSIAINGILGKDGKEQIYLPSEFDPQTIPQNLTLTGITLAEDLNQRWELMRSIIVDDQVNIFLGDGKTLELRN
jgi:hypothetical protein